MHQIRLCRSDELGKLKIFIDESWKRGHILAKNTDLLNWQYFNKSEKAYNFIVAYNMKTKALDAVLGFIPTWHYDSSLACQREIWLTLWRNDKVKSKKKMLGIDLLHYLIKKYRPTSIGGLGIGDTALEIYKLLKFKTGVLRHYYFLNSHVPEYKIADIKDKSFKVQNINNSSNPNVILKELKNLKEVINSKEISEIKCSFRPQKSIEYLRNRFCNHPVYAYYFYGMYLSGKLEAIFVIRKITIKNSSCLRIVDIFGNLVSGSLQRELRKILIEKDAEYIDCLNYGIDKNIFYSVGFLERTNNIIIPNNFEPFERENVEICFAFKADKNVDYKVFKGDGDQDRPNQIQGKNECLKN